MNTVPLQTLHNNTSFTSDLLIDNTFLVLPASVPVSDDLVKALMEWQFNSFLTDGEVSLAGDSTDYTPNVNRAQLEKKEKFKGKLSDSVKQAIDNSLQMSVGNSDNARLQMVNTVYEEYMNFIEKIFTHYATHKEVDKGDLAEAIKELCVFTKDNRRYMLRINPAVKESGRNFLVVHTMRTTVLAIAIALQMHMPLSKMIDLGVTCILHEIGMLRLPPQIYMSDRRLSPGEHAQIFKHTILGYQIMKELDFSLPIQLGVLEHHERENGSGYPQKKTGDKISTNAKIISVACSFEAISSPRKFRDGRSGFEAILEILQNKDHSYDPSIINALLHSVSLYPIGSIVYLSDRKVAQVIDANPADPKSPVVKYLTERNEDGSDKIITTGGSTKITIMRILNQNEKEDILKIVKEKFEALDEAQLEADKKAADAKVAEIKKEKAAAMAAKQQSETPSSGSSAAPGSEEVDISMFD